MSWQILNAEPAFGVCDQCKRHECGIIDGKHQWIMTGIYDKSGDAIVIGYRCVELWANNLGISREVVEQQVFLTPTDEQIGDFVRKAVGHIKNFEQGMKSFRDGEQANRQIDFMDGKHWDDAKTDELSKNIVGYVENNGGLLKKLNREQLKLYLKEKNIDFVPQWGEERLREEALKHV